jgi:hypothetical protein
MICVYTSTTPILPSWIDCLKESRIVKNIIFLKIVLLLVLMVGACSSSGTPSCKDTEDCSLGTVCDMETNTCRNPLTCDQLTCAEHQLCEQASGQDAQCLQDCEEFYSYNQLTGLCDLSWFTCQPEPALGSVLQDCLDKGRECLEVTEGQAECGDCSQQSQVVDPESGICRAPVTCNDIQCDQGLVCVQSIGEDARCSNECSGPNGELGIIHQDGYCVLCPLCADAAAGEDGPYTESLTRNDECICKTLPGFYWSLAPIGVEPCDQDADGWVRIGAQTSIEHDDPVIQANARCGLRSILGYKLINESGQTLEVALEVPAALYESKRNDHQEDLDQLPPEAPAYPVDRTPKANELNTLTKACVLENADYNDNGVYDVNEFHGQTVGSMNPAYRPFLDYGYFIELYRGWYQPGAITSNACEIPADCLSGEECDQLSGLCVTAGWYHIQEKSRALNAAVGFAMPLTIQEDAEHGPYWRNCTRKRDSQFETSAAKQSLDFAHTWDPQVHQGDWFGMNHHSQFKCMKIVPDVEQPNEVKKRDPAGAAHQPIDDYLFNDCSAAGSYPAVTGEGDKNPLDPMLVCVPQANTSLTDGDVRLAVVDYRYQETNCGTAACPEYYLNGCVNECAEMDAYCLECEQLARTREDCPGYYDDPVKGGCVDVETDFGRLACKCESHYAGANCQHACPDSDLAFGEGYLDYEPSTETRAGYWMCGHISSTSPAKDPTAETTPDPMMTGGGYRLLGEVPLAPISSNRIEAEGYSVDGRPGKQPVYTIRPAGGSYRIKKGL